MSERSKYWCDMCETVVYTGDDAPSVHSCYDAKALREQQERERALTVAEREELARLRAEVAAMGKVVEAGLAYEAALRDENDPWGYTIDKAHDAHLAAVRTYRAAQPGDGGGA